MPSLTVSEAPVAASPVSGVTSTPTELLMLGTARRGPINRPTLVVSDADFDSVFGPDDGTQIKEQVRQYFGQTEGLRLLFSRIAHYDNVDDPTSLTAIAAETDLLTGGVDPTPAIKESGTVGPWDLTEANGVSYPPTLTASIEGNVASNATFAAFSNRLTAAGAPAGIGVLNDTLTFAVQNGTGKPLKQFVYTIPAALPTTAAEWAFSIQQQIPFTKWLVVGGKVVADTEGKGSDYHVNYVSGTGTAGVQSGFGAGPTAGVAGGVNNVADLAKVTPAEAEARIEAGWTAGSGVEVTQIVPDPNNVAQKALHVETVVTGLAATIGAVTGSAAAVFGFTPGGVATGQAAGGASLPVVTVNASSEGAHGNDLSVTTKRTTSRAATLVADLAAAPTQVIKVSTAVQLRVGLQIRVFDPVTSFYLRGVVAKISGGDVTLQTTGTPTGAILVSNGAYIERETFTLQVSELGRPLFSWKDLSMSPLDAKFYVEAAIGTDPKLVDPRQRIVVEGLGVAADNDVDPRPLDVTLQELDGGDDGDAVNDNDYIGSQVGKVGLRAADRHSTFDLFYVARSGAPVQKAANEYSLYRDGIGVPALCICEVPNNLTPTAAVNWKQQDAQLIGTFGVGVLPFIRARRVATGTIEEFPPCTAYAGLCGRVTQKFNISFSPGGFEEAQGVLRGVLGVSQDNQYEDNVLSNLVGDAGLFPIFATSGENTAGVIVFGQNTFDPDSPYGVVGVRRALIAIRRGVRRLMRFVLFKPNTESLQNRVDQSLNAYLSVLKDLGVVQKFVVDARTPNTPDVIKARRFKAVITVSILPGIEDASFVLELGA